MSSHSPRRRPPNPLGMDVRSPRHDRRHENGQADWPRLGWDEKDEERSKRGQRGSPVAVPKTRTNTGSGGTSSPIYSTDHHLAIIHFPGKNKPLGQEDLVLRSKTRTRSATTHVNSLTINTAIYSTGSVESLTLILIDRLTLEQEEEERTRRGPCAPVSWTDWQSVCI